MEALQVIVRQIDARVAGVVAHEDLSLGEWRLLSALYAAGAVPPSLLADRLGLTRGGVTKLIDRLRAHRLLVRAGSGGHDRRYRTIALTGAGVTLVRDLSAAVRTAEALSAAERAQAMQALAGDGPIDDGDAKRRGD